MSYGFKEQYWAESLKHLQIGARHPFFNYMVHKGNGQFLTEPNWIKYMETIKKECEEWINI